MSKNYFIEIHKLFIKLYKTLKQTIFFKTEKTYLEFPINRNNLVKMMIYYWFKLNLKYLKLLLLLCLFSANKVTGCEKREINLKNKEVKPYVYEEKILDLLGKLGSL